MARITRHLLWRSPPRSRCRIWCMEHAYFLDEQSLFVGPPNVISRGAFSHEVVRELLIQQGFSTYSPPLSGVLGGGEFPSRASPAITGLASIFGRFFSRRYGCGTLFTRPAHPVAFSSAPGRCQGCVGMGGRTSRISAVFGFGTRRGVCWCWNGVSMDPEAPPASSPPRGMSPPVQNTSGPSVFFKSLCWRCLAGSALSVGCAGGFVGIPGTNGRAWRRDLVEPRWAGLRGFSRSARLRFARLSALSVERGGEMIELFPGGASVVGELGFAGADGPGEGGAA